MTIVLLNIDSGIHPAMMRSGSAIQADFSISERSDIGGRYPETVWIGTLNAENKAAWLNGHVRILAIAGVYSMSRMEKL